MTEFAIFAVGFVVASLTGVGAILIGLEEARDASQSRLEDLTELEKKIVGRNDETG